MKVSACLAMVMVVCTVFLFANTVSALPDSGIAVAKADANADYYPDDTNSYVTVYGHIISQSFSTNTLEMFIQDTNDNVGIQVRVDAEMNLSSFTIGKQVKVRNGRVGQYRGLRYIQPIYSSNFTIEDNTVVDIAPLNKTINELLANPESFEGSFVKIDNITATGSFPEYGNWGTVGISDGTGALNIFVDEHTDLNGQLCPTNVFGIQGIFSQYDTAATPSNGYQIVPRFYADLKTPVDSQTPSILIVESNTVSTAVGQEVVIDIIGRDRNADDTLTLSITQAPATSSFTDDGDRSGCFRWTPTAGEAGTSTTVVFQVSDDSETATASIDITVLTEEQSNILLNEVLYDPSNKNLEGDSNGDGVYSYNDDEFVEIVNNNSTSVDITGWVLQFGTNDSFTFPATVLTGKTAVVVFGGGTPTGAFGNAIVYTASNWVPLANSPGTRDVKLLTDTGAQIFSYNYASFGAPNQSITRAPDTTGNFTLHLDANPFKRFSPGTMLNGTGFAGSGMSNTPPNIASIDDVSVKIGAGLSLPVSANDPENNTITLTVSNAPASAVFSDNGDGTGTLVYTGQATDAGTQFNVTVYASDGVSTSTEDFSIYVVATTYTGLRINEYLVDPNAAGSSIHFDSNNDGVENSREDEFVEIVNGGTVDVDLTGLLLTYDGNIRHTFSTYTLPAGGAMVVFGGGTLSSFLYPPAQLATSWGSGLGNSGTHKIAVCTPQTNIIEQIEYTDSAGAISMTRSPDITGNWADHMTASGETGDKSASPGRKLTGAAFLSHQPPVLNAIGDKSVSVGAALNFTVTAHDVDNDSIVIVCSNKPSAATFTDNADGTGDFSWTPSVADVGEHSMTIYASAVDGSDSETIKITVTSASSGDGTLLISEVADPSDMWRARFVEIYNSGSTSIDLSAGNWYLARQANGGSFADIALTGTIASGDVTVIAYSSSDFNTSYGFAPDQVSGNISGNGNDGYFLYKSGDHTSGTLVDSYGVIDENGTGKDWEYTDGRAERNASITSPNTTWTASEWTITSPADTTEMSPGSHSGSGGGETPEFVGFAIDGAGANWILQWNSEVGETYRIMRSTNLLEDAFVETVKSGVIATPPVNTDTVPVDSKGKSFFRIDKE